MIRALWYEHYDTMLRALWCEHYDTSTMIRALWYKHYDTMLRALWCKHYDTMMRALWHYDTSTLIRALWYKHYDTMIRALWYEHYDTIIRAQALTWSTRQFEGPISPPGWNPPVPWAGRPCSERCKVSRSRLADECNVMQQICCMTPPGQVCQRLQKIRDVQNCICSPYMTVYSVIFLPQIPYIHLIYMVLANPSKYTQLPPYRVCLPM